MENVIAEIAKGRSLIPGDDFEDVIYTLYIIICELINLWNAGEMSPFYSSHKNTNCKCEFVFKDILDLK